MTALANVSPNTFAHVANNATHANPNREALNHVLGAGRTETRDPIDDFHCASFRPQGSRSAAEACVCWLSCL
jgi:hypothetical protein